VFNSQQPWLLKVVVVIVCITGDATLYRWHYWLEWKNKLSMCFIMLNASMADDGMDKSTHS
jgi:hypothetical protein